MKSFGSPCSRSYLVKASKGLVVMTPPKSHRTAWITPLMLAFSLMGIGAEVQGRVGLIELQDPPHNFLTADQVGAVADALEKFDADMNVGAVVLAAQGRSFCAGANFGGSGDTLRNSP